MSAPAGGGRPGPPRRVPTGVVLGLAGLFALALGVRLLFLHQYAAWPLYDRMGPIVDSRFYLLRAQQIAHGQWQDAAPYFLSPLYCYGLGLLFHVVEASQESVRILQAVLGAASCVLFAAGARRVFGTPVGLVAGALMAVEGFLVYTTAVVLPSGFVLFLHAALVFVLAGRDADPGRGRCLLAGVLLGLAAAAKPNALLTAALVAAWLAWRRRGGSPGWRARLAPAALLALGAAAALAPFTWHNWRVSGHLVLVSTNGGRNLYKSVGPEANGTHVFLEEDVGLGLRDYLDGAVDPQEPIRDSRQMAALALEHARRHPGRTLALTARKLLLALHARELGVRDSYEFARRYSSFLRHDLVGFGLLASLGLVGMVLARRVPGSGLFAVLVASQLFALVAVFVLGRYRVVLVGCFAVYAAHLLAWWAARWRERAWRPLGQSAVAVLALLVVTHLPLPGFPRDAGFALQHLALARPLRQQGDLEAARHHFLEASAGDWQGLPGEDGRRLEARADAADCAAELGQPELAREELAAVRAALDGPGAPPGSAALRARVERRLRELGPAAR